MANKKPLVLSGGSIEELQASDAVAASDISFDASGTQVSGTTVQDALAELDNDLLTFALALS